MMNKDIRWQQRFRNLQLAFTQLEKGLGVAVPNDLEKQGIIQSFEFTFELAWKTLKDYLESQKVMAQFPRDVIKYAFQYQIISDGDLWMDMLDKRNTMAHTYDEAKANQVLEQIRTLYHGAIVEVVTFFNGKIRT